ncbi:hypothetical protein BU17DRAFT_93111 [Hysterangium stoloniferum]|nr:hypothetical protein BU17DRAFT_93111 [Hysterangium stoloniferum]
MSVIPVMLFQLSMMADVMDQAVQFLSGVEEYIDTEICPKVTSRITFTTASIITMVTLPILGTAQSALKIGLTVLRDALQYENVEVVAVNDPFLDPKYVILNVSYSRSKLQLEDTYAIRVLRSSDKQCCTALHPDRVYLGHEGGFILVWTEGTDTFDSGKPVPIYVGIVKISNSDVLALEGVLDKLWTGSRSGVIAVYSVDSGDERSEGWHMTNAWRVHEELPVLWITLDPFSIAKYHLTTHHHR